MNYPSPSLFPLFFFPKKKTTSGALWAGWLVATIKRKRLGRGYNKNIAQDFMSEL
jgi:hypothetical protein